ncbi:MAG: hypothetical protein HRT35_07730 [Algicola sp.]|nr:hypothetical protein [Algicola sp.]
MSTITIAPGAPGNTKPKVELSPFAKKWAQIEKKQKRNDNFKVKLEALYARFQNDILPIEQQWCESMAQQIRHLMPFLKRKSLAKWQREELQMWIEETLDDVCGNPFCPPDLMQVLRTQYNDAMGAMFVKRDEEDIDELEIEELREFVEEFFLSEKQFSDEQLAAFLCDPASLQQLMTAFMEEKAQDAEDEYDEENQGFFGQNNPHDDDEFEFEQHQQSSPSRADKLKSMFNASEINKIYKALANRLHPDKEINPQLKAYKSELMGQLAKAKKDNDAFTIIQMYQQHMPEKASEFSPDMSQSMVQLLNVKLHELDAEMTRLKMRDGMPSMIWQKFGAPGKNKIEQKISAHIKGLRGSQRSIAKFIKGVTTVKIMKDCLAERYDDRPELAGDMDELFDALNFFAGEMETGDIKDCPF